MCPICRTPAAAASGAAPARSSDAPLARPTRSRPAAAGGDPPAPPSTYRIPCPQGHLLTAGEHMLGQQVVCPECNELFLLRREDSLEHRKNRERARRAEEERMAKVWLSRAMLAAAFIVASLVGMIALSFGFRPPLKPRPAEPPSGPAPAARSG